MSQVRLNYLQYLLRKHPELLLEQLDDSLPVDFLEVIGEVVLTSQLEQHQHDNNPHKALEWLSSNFGKFKSTRNSSVTNLLHPTQRLATMSHILECYEKNVGFIDNIKQIAQQEQRKQPEWKANRYNKRGNKRKPKQKKLTPKSKSRSSSSSSSDSSSFSSSSSSSSSSVRRSQSKKTRNNKVKNQRPKMQPVIIPKISEGEGGQPLARKQDHKEQSPKMASFWPKAQTAFIHTLPKTPIIPSYYYGFQGFSVPTYPMSNPEHPEKQ